VLFDTPGLGAPWGTSPTGAAFRWSSTFPKWTEPSFWAGGPLSATQNAESTAISAFELHVLLEVIDAVVGRIPSAAALDGAIFIPRGVDEDTT